jgi:GT2 family glycosyltransferase
MNNSDTPLTFCISTFNNLNYLKIAVDSVRKNSFFINAPFIIHAENCTDGTNEWLENNKELYNLTVIIEKNNVGPRGIGGGMNLCAENVSTEYIMFLHSDFYVTKDWDIECLKLSEKYDWVDSLRFEPNIFNQQTGFRHVAIIVSIDVFNASYNDFRNKLFDDYANKFKELNPNIEYPKLHGVSGLIKKKLWDDLGGNDPIFAPSSWDDIDLFSRFRNRGHTYTTTSNSVVWHFGARGSHRLEENNNKTSERQILSEKKNIQNFQKKWGYLPTFDEYGMVEPSNYANK